MRNKNACFHSLLLCDYDELVHLDKKQTVPLLHSENHYAIAEEDTETYWKERVEVEAQT